MESNPKNPFNSEDVCKILIRNKLIAPDKANEILHKEGFLRKKLEKKNENTFVNTPAADLISNPSTIIRCNCITSF